MKFFGPLFFLLIIFCSCYAQDTVYVNSILKHRQEKNVEFLDAVESPLDAEKLKYFKGLNYFDVNENYRVEGVFKRTENERPFIMPTSGEKKPEYVKYGEISFSLNGKQLVLSVYQNIQITKKEEYKDYLFIPFKDLSNGNNTYGGGRYLDFKTPEREKVTLDFNLSYNPYCCYSNKYSCPIPPEENHLLIEIPAGEKNFEK